MGFDVLKLLHDEGYITHDTDNLVHAEKAFFAARVMHWIRHKVETEPGFDLASYLTMLLYYKTDLAELKFSEDGDNIVYRMIDNDKEVQELVDSLIESSHKSSSNPTPGQEGKNSGSTEGPDRNPDS